MNLFICGDDFCEGDGCGSSVFIAISDCYKVPPYTHFVTLLCVGCGKARIEHLVMESQLLEKETP